MADTPDVQNNPLPVNTEEGATPLTPAPAAAPAPAPAAAAQPTQAPADQPQSRLQGIEDKTKHVLGDIFQTLAGGQKKVWQQTENGPVATYQDLKPGEMARGILAAAITGLASGYDPANRGKGPAMSSAFSAGFKGEEKAREKTADANEQEAQQTFKNKNLSDELAMRKQRFATEQQQSIATLSRTYQEIDDMATRAAQGQTLFTEGQDDRFNAQMNEYNGTIAKGGVPIVDPTKPDQPLVIHDKKEAQEIANSHGAALVKPGEFTTKAVWNPAVAGFMIVDVPIAARDKQEWRFAKMDPKTNTPIMKDGKMVPSGQRDETGQIIPPTRMTGEEYGNKIIALDKHAYDAAGTAERWANAAREREALKQTKEMKGATDRLAEAGNRPYAINTDTGEFIVKDQDRSTLRGAYSQDAARVAGVMDKAAVELQSATPEQQPELRATVAEAKAQYEFDRKGLADLGKQFTKGQALADSLLVRFEGDAKKATEKLDQAVKDNKYGGRMLPEDIDTARRSIQAYADAQTKRKDQAKAAPSEVPTPAGFQMKPVDVTPFSTTVPGGASVVRIPGLDAFATQKALSDLNGIESPSGRADYINKLNIAPDAKSQLLRSAQAVEPKPKEAIHLVIPPGQTVPVQVPESKLNEALAQGGTQVNKQ